MLEKLLLALTLAASACCTTPQPQPEAWKPHSGEVTVVQCAYNSTSKEKAREFAQRVALTYFRNYSLGKASFCYREGPDGAQCVRVSSLEQDCQE